MEAELSEQMGAGEYGRSVDQQGYPNGYRDRPGEAEGSRGVDGGGGAAAVSQPGMPEGD